MNDYIKNLPKKRMGAGVLIFDMVGKLLVVKQKYKDRWSIPGGTVEENESPRKACLREIKEEIGIDMESVTFLSVDYTPKNSDKTESLQFMFYGGVFDEQQIKQIKIQEKELSEYRFVDVKDAVELLSGPTRNLGKRLLTCIESIKTGKAIYLEDGQF